MKKLILIILLMPLTILCQDDYPEWEKIDYKLDSTYLYSSLKVNSENELFIVMKTGIYKSIDDGENWEKLNTPDSLIYNQYFLKLNGPTIYTYAKVYNFDTTTVQYFVYSNDKGESWSVIPVDELIFPGYESSEFMFIDEKGEIWGISSNKKIDSSSKLVVNKFDVLNKTTTKMYDLPNSYYKILFQDSLTVLINYNKPPGYKDEDPLAWKELATYFSYNNGNTWDSAFFNIHNTTDYFEIRNYVSEDSFIFESKGFIYVNSSSLYYAWDLELLKIDLKSKKLTFETLGRWQGTRIKKINDSTFYKFENRDNIPGCPVIYKSNDVANWELVISSCEFDECDFYDHYWFMDRRENHFLMNDQKGLIRVEKGSESCTRVNDDGLVDFSAIKHIAVDSKSNIVFPNAISLSYNSPLRLFSFNPDTGIKHSSKFSIPDDSYFQVLPNDKFIFRVGYEIRVTNSSLQDSSTFRMNDSNIISHFYNIHTRGRKYLAIVVTEENNKSISSLAYTEDIGETWKIIERIKKPDSLSGYAYLNTNLDIFYIASYSRIYLSKDFGQTWKRIFNDSTNPLLFKNKYSYQVYGTNYNESSGTGFVKYYDNGPMYYTLDHGYTWKSLDSNLQSYKLMNQLPEELDYIEYNNLPYAYDNSQVFYLSTPNGIFRSKDSLQSFQCISKGKIEPSFIYDFQAGYDGRLYAVNYNGFWRTKTRVTSVENETKPVISGDMKLKVYPNPAGDYIEIIINNKGLKPFAEFEKVQIFDMLGIEVGQSSLIVNDNSNIVNDSQAGMPNLLRIDISQLTSGLYFIKIGDKVEKFVKM